MHENICTSEAGCARLEAKLPNFDLTLYNPLTDDVEKIIIDKDYNRTLKSLGGEGAEKI